MGGKNVRLFFSDRCWPHVRKSGGEGVVVCILRQRRQQSKKMEVRVEVQETR